MVGTAPEVTVMHEATKALRAHHAELVDELTRRAQSPGDGLALAAFLSERLVPHLRAEERDLYPAVDALMAMHRHPTATMRVEHDVIIDHATQLADAAAAAARAPSRDRAEAEARVRELAIRIEAVVLMHVTAEETVYLPLLETRLPESDQDALLRRLAADEPAVPVA